MCLSLSFLLLLFCSSVYTEQTKLSPIHSFSNQFGGSVSVSGNLILAGSPSEGANPGSAYIYDCSTFPCQVKQTLLASDSDEYDHFGRTVSISKGYAFVSSPLKYGAVYFFNCSTFPCQEKQKLVDNHTGPTSNYFGYSISNYENILVVGSFGENSHRGSAYIYDCSIFPCQEKQKLINSNSSTPSSFGYSVSISGKLVVIGAQLENYGQGSAYIYDCSTFPCKEKQKLNASDSSDIGYFGCSVSVSGNLVVIGATGTDSYRGSAYIYDCSTFPCQEKQKMVASDGKSNGNFGESVSISGNTVVVGTTYDNRYAGAAYLFDCSSFPCLEKQKIILKDAEDFEYFGRSISISGSLLAVGAPGDDYSNGSVSVYRN